MAKDLQPVRGSARARGASITAGDWLNRSPSRSVYRSQDRRVPSFFCFFSRGADGNASISSACGPVGSRRGSGLRDGGGRLRANPGGPGAPGWPGQAALDGGRHQPGPSEQPQPARGAHQPRTAGSRHRPGQDGVDAESDRFGVDLEPDQPDQRLLLGRHRQADARQFRDRRRREPGGALGRQLQRVVGHGAQRVEQRVRQPEPLAGHQSQFQLHAAAAPEPQDRFGAQSARGQQDEPRDLGHRPAPDRADNRAEREVRVLGRQGGRRGAAGGAPVPRSRP